ncbi:protein indeterminate-domain 4, chloroplastic-like [Miscanthus floridulus]|uniref:protein indeterminate-domain 4, chloroplastic-like n=1 Tax=Miscanthus floridulus TaxID=154761 RepID=UPI003459451B
MADVIFSYEIQFTKITCLVSIWCVFSQLAGHSRRDSFITHRAFCDALAQESARVPPIGAGMCGTGGMALGLSGMAASHQLQSFQDQAHSSATTTIGSNPAAQFEHLMQSSAGSPAFRGAQPTSSSSSPFYLGGAEDGHQSQTSHTSLLHGNKQAYHGLMQLPEQHQPGSNGLLNLGFFSGGSGGQDARLVFPDQFNGAVGGNVRGNSRTNMSATGKPIGILSATGKPIGILSATGKPTGPIGIRQAESSLQGPTSYPRVHGLCKMANV